MAGTQTAGFDLVLQFSEEAYQELLGVFFDTSGLIPRLVDLIPGLEAEDFSLTVSLDRPTDVPLTPPAENPLDLRLVLGQGAAAATFRIVVGITVDRAATDRDTVRIDFPGSISFAEVRVGGVALPIPNLVGRLAGLLPAVPVLPVPVDRGATEPTTITRADFRIVDDVSAADRDATAGMLTFGGGVVGNAAALRSFVPDGGRGAVGIFFNWIARMAVPALERALDLPAGSFTIGPDSASLNRTVRVDEDEDVDLTKLTISLDDGFIRIDARVTKSGFCYDASGDVGAKLRLAVVPEPDPDRPGRTRGRLQASVEIGDPDVDVDIPWYCWLAAGVIGAALGGLLLGVIGAVVGTVLVPLILWIATDTVEGTIDRVADRIVEAINQAVPDVDVPAFGVDILFQSVFIDDVVIRASLEIQDRAPIRCEGTVRLHPGQSLDLDLGRVTDAASAPGDLRWVGQSWGRRLETGCQAGLARTGRTDLGGVQRFQLYGLPYQTRTGLGVLELGRFDPFGIFTGDFIDESRAVLAVRTNEGRYALAQATRIDQTSWVELRYRTYEKKVPTVSIAGEFQCTFPPVISTDVTAVFEPARTVEGKPALRQVTAAGPMRRERAAAMCGEDAECLSTVGQRLEARYVLAFGVGRAVPDEIEAAFAGARRVAETGHRVAEHVFARGKAEGEFRKQVAVGPGRQVIFVGQSAPGDVAGVTRRRVRRKLRAHRGADAVGTDQQVAPCRGAVAEMRSDAVRILRDADAGVAEVVTRRGEGVQQQLVQPAPGGQALPHRQRAQHRAVAAEGDAARDVDADAVTGRDADARQRVEEVGVGDDAGAAAGQRLRGLLEDLDIPAPALQQVGGEESAQRAADDQRARHRGFRRPRLRRRDNSVPA